MNALDSLEFKSKTRNDSRPFHENDGVTMEFLNEFMSEFANQSIGMDLSDVNFQVTKDNACRHADSQTFRELFELILDSINKKQISTMSFYEDLENIQSSKTYSIDYHE